MSQMRLIFIPSLTACMLSAACGTVPPSISAGQVQRLASFDYPENSHYGEDYAVFARQDGHWLHLSNTSTTAMRDVQVWINQQWCMEMPIIEVGSGQTLNLADCINSYGESFPIGQALRPELTRKVMLVELYDPNTQTRHRLTTLPSDP